MEKILPSLIMLLMISSLYMLSTSRLGTLIKVVGLQGIALSLVPFLTHHSIAEIHTWVLIISGFFVKGVVIPILLSKALRGIAINREIEPYVGFSLSIIIGVISVALAFIVHNYISNYPLFHSPFIPAAIVIGFCGLFLIIARKQALTQVIGYLVFENGIYLFGVSLAVNNPLLVELGILLDVLVGVFVMGIVVYHINKEFDSISTDDLDTLRE